MSLTTKSFQKGRDLIKVFLDKHLNPADTFLRWKFVGEDSVYTETAAKDLSSAGLDVYVWNQELPSEVKRIRCFITEKTNGVYAAPHYNLSSEISKQGQLESTVKSNAFNFFTTNDLFFLVVRKKGLSTTFWLDRFDSYLPSSYTLQTRFKSKSKSHIAPRLDRITLHYSTLNLKQFHYIEELIQRLNTAINENSNRKTT